MRFNFCTALRAYRPPGQCAIYRAGQEDYSYYAPDVASATDYYLFGMPMPGRTLADNTYRFGFNGQIKDNDIIITFVIE